MPNFQCMMMIYKKLYQPVIVLLLLAVLFLLCKLLHWKWNTYCINLKVCQNISRSCLFTENFTHEMLKTSYEQNLKLCRISIFPFGTIQIWHILCHFYCSILTVWLDQSANVGMYCSCSTMWFVDFTFLPNIICRSPMSTDEEETYEADRMVCNKTPLH